MTREELRDYVEEQRTLNIIPYHVYSALIDGIDTLEQKPRWIPVSERTPEHGGEYLLWGKICEDDDEDYCFIGEYHEFDEEFGWEESYYDRDTLGYLDTELKNYHSVIAWQPLPSPYVVEEQGENT